MITVESKEYKRYKPVRERIVAFIESELSGSSLDTQRSYYYSLELFFEYLLLNHAISFPNYTEKEINDFIISISKKSSSYINRVYAAVQKYSSYSNVSINKKKINLPKQDDYKQIQPRSLNDKESEIIENKLYMAYIKQKEKNKNKRSLLPSTGKERDTLRNYVLYRIMIQTSIRISEAISLDFDDLFLDGKREETRYLLIRGKGNKKRKVPISMDLKDLLIYYIDFRNRYDEEIEFEKLYFNLINHRLSEETLKQIEQCFSTSEKETLEKLNIKTSLSFGEVMLRLDIYTNAIRELIKRSFKQNKSLFISNRGKRVNKDTMMKMFKKYGLKSHVLRHTAIKTLVDKGVSINKVQLISGHSSADMVLRYSKPTFEEIQTEIDKNQRNFYRDF